MKRIARIPRLDRRRRSSSRPSRSASRSPEWQRWSQRAGARRPGLHAALHAQPVARHRALVLGPPRAIRHARARQRARRARHSRRHQLDRGNRQNKRWDLTARRAVHAVGSDPEGAPGAPNPVNVKVFATSEDFERFRDRLDEYQYVSTGEGRVRRRRQAAGRGRAVPGSAVRHGRVRVRRPHASARRPTPNRTSPTPSSRRWRAAEEGVLRPGPRREGHDRVRPRRATRRCRRRSRPTTSRSSKVALAQQKDVPADATVVVIAGPQDDFLPPRSTWCARTSRRAARLLVLLDPPARADSPQLTNLRHCCTNGASRPEATSSSM